MKRTDYLVTVAVALLCVISAAFAIPAIVSVTEHDTARWELVIVAGACFALAYAIQVSWRVKRGIRR